MRNQLVSSLIFSLIEFSTLSLRLFPMIFDASSRRMLLSYLRVKNGKTLNEVKSLKPKDEYAAGAHKDCILNHQNSLYVLEDMFLATLSTQLIHKGLYTHSCFVLYSIQLWTNTRTDTHFTLVCSASVLNTSVLAESSRRK